jgi:uncharacterized repeat protein (TIGR01451 family)
VTDTATATGTDAAGDTSPASASYVSTVPVGQPPQPLTPTATANPTPIGLTATELEVHKHVSAATAYPGQKLTYALTVTNAGPAIASDVKLTDTPTLPLKVLSIHSARGGCQRRAPITCTLGTLAAGETAKITIVAEVKRTGTERNTAAATSATALLDPGSATATASTKIAPILHVRKTASTARATTGQNITYTITVTNPTLVAIHKIAVCDALPPGLLYLSSSAGANIRTGQPCWTIPILPAGHGKRFTVVANAAPGYGGRLVNRASANAPGVRTAHTSAPVTVTRAPQVPCAIGSQASTSAPGHPAQNPPIAKAAC